MAVKRELEEAESGLSAICKVLDCSLSTTRSMKSDRGSYKPTSSHKSYVLRLIQDNNNNNTPPPDVPADVNVHVHDNAKPL